MKRITLLLSLSIGLLAGCAQAQSEPESSVEPELNQLLDLMSGEYAGLAPDGLVPEGKVQQLIYSLQPVTAPQFGERLMYYRVTSAAADGPILQAKIFVFSSDPDRSTNSMYALVLTPEQAERIRTEGAGAWRDLEKSSLLSFPETCFFTWSRTDDGFAGEGSDTCSYESRAFSQTITPDMRYAVSRDALQLEETLFGEDGKAVVTTGGLLTATRQ